MLFSVIIPAYNAEKFIKRSIDSVLKQSFQDFEIIVINDGSMDSTLEILYQISDERLKIIDTSNGGVSKARNLGIEHARGEYICFLDSDDEFLPSHLEHLNNLIVKYPSKSFFATRFCMTTRNDVSEVNIPKITGKIEFYEDAVSKILMCSEMIWTGCVCIRRKMFEKYGMFEIGVKLGEDTDMWKRVYVHTGVVFSDNITVKRNRDGSEATKNYIRSFKLDPLNRIGMFLEDETISEDVKRSLLIEYEYTKLSIVRSYLLIGDKKNAKIEIDKIDKKMIPYRRWLITKLCFILPSCLIRLVMKIKNRKIYD